jgi:hypothetical protein
MHFWRDTFPNKTLEIQPQALADNITCPHFHLGHAYCHCVSCHRQGSSQGILAYWAGTPAPAGMLETKPKKKFFFFKFHVLINVFLTRDGVSSL